MRSLKMNITAFLLIITIIQLFPSVARCAHIFVVRESIGGVEIGKVEIADGDVMILDGEDVITVVIPLGAGQSGDLVSRDMRSGEITVRSAGGELHISKKHADGREMAYPVVKVADLHAYDIRVNIAGGDGLKIAFRIDQYEEVEEDDGPVIDMFAGRIPLEDGDYSITLEISAAESAAYVSGETTIIYEKGFLLTEGALSDGRKGWFLVDFGASGTLITKEFLPAYIDIAEVKGLEYSDRGRREIKSVMSGAGGDVTGFLGSASPGNMIFGDVIFSDVSIKVIEAMPDFGSREIVGILGLDLMRLCDRIAFEYPRSGPGIMMMGERHSLAETDAPQAEVPFYLVAKHIFLDGEVNEVPVSFLFDTGARSSILSDSKAKKARLKDSEDGRKGEVRGLDDNPVETRLVIADRLRLGEWLRSDVPFLAADLSVFESIGLRQGGGIIGNDFLDDYRLVEIDFSRGVISLWK
ncbi:MAG: aspartyl protease family protein [Candidatus Krumholzibacteria bacterium]|nr:aspartyl protease family protein [Candidatus Krumholzibacteria bacterium]